MLKVLRRMLAMALLGLAPLAAATPCVSGSLQDYINLAAGCDIGGVTFSGFAVAPGQAAATPIDPNLIVVTPGSASDPGFAFAIGVVAGAGELFEAFFHYQMLAAPGAEITGASLALGASSATGDGVVTAVQDLCLGGTFDPTQPVGCTGTALSLIALEAEGISLGDSALFAGVSVIDVFMDFVVDGGLFGSATLGSGTTQSGTTGGNPVAEPSTLALTLLALALAARTRRRPGIR